MAMTEEQLAQTVAEAVAKENAKLLGASRGPAGGGGGGGGSDMASAKIASDRLNLFNTAATTATSGLLQLWQGSMTAANAVNGLGTVIGKIPGIGPALEGLTKGVGQAVVGTNDNLNQAARNGANFNNNLTAYDNLVKGARLTQEEYNNVVKNNSTALNGLGSTVNRSQTNFLQFTKGLQESPVASQLKALGYSAEEIAEIGLANMANTRGLNLADAEARKQAIDSSIRMAQTMDDNTRITGKSRDAQLADIKARGENVVVQAAVMQLGADGMQRYKEMQTKMEGMGKGVQDVADELFTGGIRTKEGAAKMAALGPAGAELEKAVLASKNAKTAEQRAAADEQMLKARAAIADYQRSKSYLDMVQYGTGAASDAARAMMKENVEAQSVMAKRAEAKPGEKADTAALQAAQTKEVALSREGKNVLGKQIEEPGRDAAVALNKVNSASKDLAAGASVGFGKLIAETDKLVGGFKALGGEITKPRTQEQAAGAGKQVINEMGSTIRDAIGLRRTPNPTATTPEQAAGGVPKQATGSKDVFGDWFAKDWGKGGLSMLHGKEAVVPQDKIGEFMKDMQAQLLPPMPEMPAMPVNNMADAIAAAKSQLPSSPKIDTSGMSVEEMDARKKAEWNAATPQPLSADYKKETKKTAPASHEITMKDLHEDLVQLNKMMGQLIAHSAESVDATHKVARATKNAGNRLLPA